MKKKVLSGTFLSILALCATYLDINSQTNMFGNHPQHLGYYESEITSNSLPSKKWSFKTNDRIFSSAAISNEVIYFGSDDNWFYALNIDGTLKWKFESNGPIRSTAAIKDTLVCFHNYGSKFYALDTRTGLELWSFETDSEMVNTKTGINGLQPSTQMFEDPWDMYQSSTVYIDTIAYFGSGNYMYAINLKNGKKVWKYEAPLVIHSTPAIYEGTVYFGCWDSNLYALDALTGDVKWIAPTGKDAGHFMEGIQSSPSVVDSFVFIGSRDAYVYAFHTKTGKQLWKTSFGSSWMPSSFAILNDTVYTGSSDAGGFFALDKFSGKIKYSLNFKCFTFSTPAITNNFAFIGCMNGSVFTVDLKTRKIRCRFDTDGRKVNIINVIRPDGSLNTDVLNPVSTSKYEDAVEYVNRVYSAGSVLSSPVIYKSVIYFGSTDSCFYAVYDSGQCNPQFSISEPNFGLGERASFLDTSFTITNTNGCSDSLGISIQFLSLLNKGVTLEADKIFLDINESRKIKVKIDFSVMKIKSYKGGFIIKSKTNEYTTANIPMSFSLKTDIAYKPSNALKFDVYPNPFNNYINISYSLEKNCAVDICIFNTVGQKVKTLVKNIQANGQYTIKWDGTNSLGNKVSSGVYYCSVRLDNQMNSNLLIYK